MNYLHHIKTAQPLLLKRLYRAQAVTHGLVHKKFESEDILNKDFSIQNSEEARRFFRKNGKSFASIDPLDLRSISCLETLSKRFTEIPDAELDNLKDIYCRDIAYDFSHMQNEFEKDWLYKNVETGLPEITTDDQRAICKHMLKSQIFENFLAKKYPTLKRYSGEGGESMLAFFEQLFNTSAKAGAEDILISIPHRGRLALLTGMLNYSSKSLFSKLKGHPEFGPSYRFTGDVSSHLTSSTDLDYNGKNLHVTMIPNPSHLEASHPVVMGKARSRFLSKNLAYYNAENGSEDDTKKILAVQVHGDAAMAGQGIVMETLSLMTLPHFEIGGSIHLVVNNQIGFTTPQERATTSDHCSDIGKMVSAPIIHVNGDNPEAVAKVTRLAIEYRNTFFKDVIINMHCFRRWGHNELDDPTFTNPEMYKVIQQRKSVPDLYKNKLIEMGVATESELSQVEKEYDELLEEELKDADRYVDPVWTPFKGKWENIQQADPKSVTVWDTGCDLNLLKFVGASSIVLPEDFTVHQHLDKTFIQARQKKLDLGQSIDWAMAEMLAVGTLLMQGHNVRLCGQDVGRGTFSHRHSMLVDQQSNQLYIPLNEMSEDQTKFLEVVNSLLSEEAVLAYEYGISIENPNQLTIWEAQFGDFFNGAQIIIDNFLANGEAKWLLQSGLVMLLPHGMDGAGPDHSSSKIERFLQLSDSKEDEVDGDDVNMQLVNPTTAAQYFHLLRRQQIRNFRKPLVVASPKLILRMSAASSSLEEMVTGTHFRPVIEDSSGVENNKIESLVFCSGKHYYELEKQRKVQEKNNVAIVRLESLVPFPAEELKIELSKYSNVKNFIWSQEEHRNQGAWSFVFPRFQNLLNLKLSYHGRPVLSASAVGVNKWHNEEVEQLIKTMFP